MPTTINSSGVLFNNGGTLTGSSDVNSQNYLTWDGILNAQVGYGNLAEPSSYYAYTPRFDLYQNFTITLTGNITLNNPSQTKYRPQPGQSGIFVFIHTGRTLSLGTDYETPGGNGITLSGGATQTVDLVPYYARGTTAIMLGTPLLNYS
jgi:hypothetical protein